MCGIFALLNNSATFNKQYVTECFNKGKQRGPEYSELKTITSLVEFGFHRLAINGLNSESNQPMCIQDVTLICNGEIYNFKELFETINVKPTTGSDCEIIIHLYKLYGMEYTLSLLDGYFSFVLIDASNAFEEPTIYIARDPHGVRPLYILNFSNLKMENEFGALEKTIIREPIIAVASELKSLIDLLNVNDKCIAYEPYYSPYAHHPQYSYSIEQYLPGSFSRLTRECKINSNYKFDIYCKKYNTLPRANMRMIDNEYNIFQLVHNTFTDAVKKRVVGTTERPIACLLSGGLDSSLVAALVARFNSNPIETYSIGMPGGEDLRYAKMVSEHIGSKHTEIIVSEDDFFNAIPNVIQAIESYDTTTVRASVGNYLVSKYISENSKAKVIFNGDGSDELTGGYLYFKAAPNGIAFDCEIKRLLSDIYMYDVLRSDKSISSHGLEPRTPFLDTQWVNTYLSIPLTFRYTPDKPEKWLLRKSFEVMAPELLPSEVLWRTKEAFSDGVSSQNKSWYEIITDRVSCMEFNNDFNKIDHLQPKTMEQKYYRHLFDSMYPRCEKIIPYFWMPKFVDASDASARTLKIYKEINCLETNL